ncbi:protein tramtrack, beta isoform isoform X2 [Calliphora vicina]|uniref:protein tramtrack, beta isoform isoform X2 n=1 Tax=Calliphora vicina TaxID=7373 RepID=UPI00325BA866
MLPQQYCLRWKYHHSNLQTMFSQLLDRGCFCDVTLACEGQLIRAHRVVLCACSTFFDTVLTNYASERDPIIIMKDITFADIKCLIEFMYKGEINVEHANLASLLKTADDLKIKGLAEVTWRDDEDIPPPPTPQTEFHSPPQSRNRYDSYGHEAPHRSQSPDTEREQKTPSPKHSAIATRMPTLTPIPTSAVSIVAAASSPIDSYMGPKRKRGRPPLDDAYDVFNVRKLGHYNDQGESTSYLEGSQFNDEQNNHRVTSQHSRPNSPSAASVVYQQHIQQQKQRLRYRPSRIQHEDDVLDDESATEPEWITSSLEHENEQKDPLDHNDEEEDELQSIKEENDDNTAAKRSTEKRSKESTPEHPKMKVLKRKTSKEESLQHKSENEDELETVDSATVPQTVEEIETKQQSTKEKSSAGATNTSTSSTTTNNSTASATSSSASSPSTSAAHKSSASSHHHHSHHSHHSHSHSHHAPPPPPLHHPHHYGKYVPEGYLINEHGILMTHDFIHAPTASIPTSSTSASNGHHPDEYVDIKMEEFTEAELRLTTEEMSQWQDVIKMDDYLAKGRRPQFWEEPFTRRVLDAIKNKRLEMKKAARILGVSYGTLYGRYREVYGCLKHPYSTSLRPSQSSALSVQPRFDIVWPSPKPGQLDIGKLRPKDLSELWTRPQM